MAAISFRDFTFIWTYVSVTRLTDVMDKKVTAAELSTLLTEGETPYVTSDANAVQASVSTLVQQIQANPDSYSDVKTDLVAVATSQAIWPVGDVHPTLNELSEL